MDLSAAALKLNDQDAAVRGQAQAAVLAAKQGAVPALIAALAVPGAPVSKIALFLTALHASEAVPALVSLVERGVLDADARTVVGRAFAELVEGSHAGDERTRRAVAQLARDPLAATRASAVRALGALGDPDSVALLKSMAFQEHATDVKQALLTELKAITEREAALAALAGPPTARPAQDGGMAFDLEAAVRAHQANAPSLPPLTGPFGALMTRLCDPRWAIKNAAVEEAVRDYAAAGAPARAELIAALTDVLQHRPAGAKLAAAQALGRMQAPDAAAPLRDALLQVAAAGDATDADSDAFVPVALKALANCLTGVEEGFAAPLLPLTRHREPFVRAGALLCLGRLADRVGARAATLALTDEHDHVREAAAVALSESAREEDQELVAPLLGVLQARPGPTDAVREAILLSLARIHIDDAPLLVRVRHSVRRHVLGATASQRRTALAVLERAFTSDDPPPLGVVDDVLSRLSDDHPEVRLLAASFLAQHLEPGMTDAVQLLEDALDRQEGPVSLLCLEALRRHDTELSKAALEAVAADADAALAERARALLADFAPKTALWVAAVAPPQEPPPADKPVPAQVEPEVVVAVAPVSEAPRRSRVKPASGADDVVEAKDAGSAVDDERARLVERLRGLEHLEAGARQAARARVLSSFAASVPQRLADALRAGDRAAALADFKAALPHP